MLGVIDLPTYLAGLVLIILLPGPNSLYVLSVAARRGVRTGYKAAAGVFTGDAVLMALTALGAGALLRASPLVFTLVKFLGAGYLAWLAVGMMRGAWALWRTRRERDEARADAPADPAENERPYRRALLISLLNPKAILFLMSFFVQFVSESNPIVGFVTLGLLLQMASVLYLSALIFGGTRLAAVFRRRRTLSAGVTSAAGVLFMGFAAKLSLASA
ncbi:leucine efflux protein LeuE [Streptomyces sp. NRRL S-378]|uniref:leucine efflux protein LeuE n=1 Tax=Streptomyces sp. NRRL S-378 TaxID=1463904 RepID=UPI0004C67421|nr:leucine efflux protein LeuE [Streptomyces sp. NRRL S-378]